MIKWLAAVLLALAAAITGLAYTQTVVGAAAGNGSVSSAGGTIQWTMTSVGFSWQFTLTTDDPSGSPTYGVFMYPTSGSGGSIGSGSSVFDRNNNSGSTITGTGSASATNGAWYAATSRVVTGGNATDTVFYFQVVLHANTRRIIGTNTSGVAFKIGAIDHSTHAAVADTAGNVTELVQPGASYDISWSITGSTTLDIVKFVQGSQGTDGVWLEDTTWAPASQNLFTNDGGGVSTAPTNVDGLVASAGDRSMVPRGSIFVFCYFPE